MRKFITIDKNAAYPPAFQQLMNEKSLSKEESKCPSAVLAEEAD
jgi:hypothetical protein